MGPRWGVIVKYGKCTVTIVMDETITQDNNYKFMKTKEPLLELLDQFDGIQRNTL